MVGTPPLPLTAVEAGPAPQPQRPVTSPDRVHRPAAQGDTEVGHQGGVCTVTSAARAEAQGLATYVLPGGQITGQVLTVLGDPAEYSVAITGGSVSYVLVGDATPRFVCVSVRLRWSCALGHLLQGNSQPTPRLGQGRLATMRAWNPTADGAGMVTRRWVDEHGQEIEESDRGLVYDLQMLVDRRKVLGLFGGLSAAALLAACGGSGASGSAAGATTATSASDSTASSAGGDLAEVPEETAGPYPGTGPTGPTCWTTRGLLAVTSGPASGPRRPRPRGCR
jgi:hypothetical protein